MKDSNPLKYGKASDDPGGTTCPRCGTWVPNTTAGHPYPHTCPKGR